MRQKFRDETDIVSELVFPDRTEILMKNLRNKTLAN
jgi:hypothetical protein